MTSAPNLETINISNCKKLMKPPLFLFPLKQNSLKCLHSFMANGAAFSSTQLGCILAAAPNLETLEINNSNLSKKPMNLQPRTLTQLKNISATYSSITTLQLKNILEAAPHLEKINIGYCDHLGSASLNLNPRSLMHLTHVSANYSSLTVEQLRQIIKAAPHLESILFQSEPQKKDGRLDLSLDYTMIQTLRDLNPDEFQAKLAQLHEKEHPYVKPSVPTFAPTKTPLGFNPKFPPDSPQTASKTQEEEAPIDGQLLNDPNKEFQNKQLMIGHLSHPPTMAYHLNSFKWRRPGSFKRYIPEASHLKPIASIYSTLDKVQTAFKKDKTASHFYGQQNFGPLKRGVFYQLPALSTRDKLLHIASNMSDYRVFQDKISGYYFLTVPRDISPGIVNFIIESKPDKPHRGEAFNPSIIEWIQQLQFNTDGSLAPNEAFHRLKALPINELIEGLTQYCKFPNESAPDYAGTPIETLNHLLKIRAGACRHRAQLFVALAEELGLKASYIGNDSHAFVSIIDRLKEPRVIQLGGAPANLKEIPMEPVKEDIPPIEADLPVEEEPFRPEDQIEEIAFSDEPTQAAEPSGTNRFKTWDNLPLEARDMSTLAQAIQVQTTLTSRRLVIMDDPLAIEALHEALLDRQAPSFFSQNLDAMSLRTLKASDGPYEIIDSPLAAFLKNAQQHPEEHFVWFINWSNPKAEQVGLNSIIDDKDRRLAHITLPANLHIVVVIDAMSAASMGEDFYSRFDGISQARQLNAQSTIVPQIETTKAIEPEDILLLTADDWQNLLLGSYHINGKHIEFIPGALFKAIDRHATHLCIQNAPWENPEFRWFMSELLKTKRWVINGCEYTLPDDLHIESFKPLYHYPDHSKQAVTDLNPQAMSISEKSVALDKPQLFVLNALTYVYCFPHHKVSSTGTIELSPGFLQPDTSINILVTENLSDAQWYKLWESAEKMHCNIELQCLPQVTVPKGLQHWIKTSEKCQPQRPVELIVANDLDDAEEHYPANALHIPISPETSFENLFCPIHRHNDAFIFEETALLKAIHEGKEPIILKGKFAKELVQKMETLFANPPSLYINGERILIKSPIIILTDDETLFEGIVHESMHYDPENDINKLAPPLQKTLKMVYESLSITPCHSHFMNLPKNKVEQEKWVQSLSLQLQLSAGRSGNPKQATEPEAVLTYLETHPFVFLVSETGAGKSYFVERVLQNYGAMHGRDISIHHGLEQVKQWALHGGDAYLFLDEANLSAEHFYLFDNLARKERIIWIDGQSYPLSAQHKVIFAGNPKQYEGRFEADLLRRFPYYFEFKGQPLDKIINPLLKFFENKKEILALIETYYQKALDAGLNITPRNAQAMCLTAFILKQLPLTQHMPELFLFHFAVLNEIESLSPDRPLMQALGQNEKELKSIDKALESQIASPKTTDFIMTESRKRIAITLQMLFMIREKRMNKEIDPSVGINGIVLEGEPGLGKSRLLFTILQANNIPFTVVTTSNPETMRTELLNAFHRGEVAIIDELNSFPDEQLLNALLSGTDLNGKKADTPGFCLLGTQNPITFKGRETLSKAFANRLISLTLKQYEPKELEKILEEKFNLSKDTAVQLITEYHTARDYAQTQGLFPPPNLRKLFKEADEQGLKKNPPKT